MAGEVEHRGWEISNDYQKHYLDDPYFDFVDDDTERFNGSFWIVLVLTAAVIIGTYLLGKWLEPPPLVFKPPAVPQLSFTSSYGNHISGNYIIDSSSWSDSSCSTYGGNSTSTMCVGGR